MRKWLGRIWESVEAGVAVFICVSILNKLIFQLDDWLFRSLAACIPCFFAKLVVYYFLVDKKRKRWALVVSTVIYVFIGSLFVFGVCLSLEEYWSETSMITFFSAWAMGFTQVDKTKDEKRSAKRTKEMANVDVVV